MPEYTYEIELEPQYRDLDPNGHVNQAVYASYCEQARSEYWADVVGQRHDRAALVMVRSEMDFAAEIRLGETVTVRQRIGELGDTSIPIDYEVSVDGESAATGSVVLLSYDREAREPAAIPEAWRTAIVEYEDHDA